jgi:hypothetical protein
MVVVAACKKPPTQGDLPPATDTPPPTRPATAETPSAPPAAGSAGGDSAHGLVPQKTPPKSLDALPEGRVAMGPFSMIPPAGWTAVPVTSSMRAAQFTLPAKAGQEAELVVTYFGPNGAGPVEDNINRWLGQFTQADGKQSREVARIEKLQVAGQEATVVAVAGRYVTQGMPGGGGPVDKPDQALLAAIVPSPSGPFYFKLVGGKPTVDGEAAAFRAMLASFQLR